MTVENLARPGPLALGILGIAADVAAARDPDVMPRTARGLPRGLKRATLTAAQAWEHAGDLWAEAHENTIAEVDTADFERAAAKASPAVPANATAAAPRKSARRSTATRRTTRAPRKSAAQADVAQAIDPT